MKKQTIWGYPGLCLCLIIPFLLCSCAGSKLLSSGVKVAQTTVPADVWKVDVLFLPDESDFQTPATYEAFTFQPYLVSGLFKRGQPRLMRLTFRLHDMLEVSMVRDKLYASGQIRQINISGPSN